MKKSARLGMRVNPQDKMQWILEARRDGYTSLAAWITDRLNEYCQYEKFNEPKN